MSARPTLIFDFDSTLVDFETLEALADIALAEDHRIEQLIRAAMDTHAAEQAGHAGEAAGRSAPV